MTKIKLLKFLLGLSFINCLVRLMTRRILQSDHVPFKLKLFFDDVIVRNCPAASIAAFSIQVWKGKAIRMLGSMEHTEVKELYWWGRFAHEPETLPLFMDLCGKSRVFFDVGANLGYYSLLARAANPNVRVFSFEPIPEIRKLCIANLQLNGFGDVVVEEIAVTDHAGKVKIFIPDDSISSASLNREFRQNTTEKEVAAAALDEYVAQKGLPFPDLVKMDTETTEHLVLQGMKNILSRKAPDIICEVLDSCDADRLTDILKPFGYNFYFIVHDGLLKMDRIKRNNALDWRSKQKTPFYNFYFTTRDI